MKTSIDNEMNGSDDESKISSQLNVNKKSLTTITTERNDSSQTMNGWSSDGRHETIEDMNNRSGEERTGIRLLCEAVNVVEKKPHKCKQQSNGLIFDKKSSLKSDAIINSCNNDLSSHLCTTSSSISCCCSSATNSCDINNESLVHPIDCIINDNKEIKCLRDRLESDLNINTNHFSNNIDSNDSNNELSNRIVYVNYESEKQMPDIMRLIQKDLSEPYSIYTYRYFIHNWPHLCFLAMDNESCVGAIVCKLDLHKKMVKRGYIAMLAVDEKYRKMKIGSNLVLRAIQAMVTGDADEVVLETEVTNKPALQLYENLGFVRDKRLFRYYLNGVDALRLKLWLK